MNRLLQALLLAVILIGLPLGAAPASGPRAGDHTASTSLAGASGGCVEPGSDALPYLFGAPDNIVAMIYDGDTGGLVLLSRPEGLGGAAALTVYPAGTTTLIGVIPDGYKPFLLDTTGPWAVAVVRAPQGPGWSMVAVVNTSRGRLEGYTVVEGAVVDAASGPGYIAIIAAQPDGPARLLVYSVPSLRTILEKRLPGAPVALEASGILAVLSETGEATLLTVYEPGEGEWSSRTVTIAGEPLALSVSGGRAVIAVYADNGEPRVELLQTAAGEVRLAGEIVVDRLLDASVSCEGTLGLAAESLGVETYIWASLSSGTLTVSTRPTSLKGDAVPVPLRENTGCTLVLANGTHTELSTPTGSLVVAPEPSTVEPAVWGLGDGLVVASLYSGGSLLVDTTSMNLSVLPWHVEAASGPYLYIPGLGVARLDPQRGVSIVERLREVVAADHAWGSTYARLVPTRGGLAVQLYNASTGSVEAEIPLPGSYRDGPAAIVASMGEIIASAPGPSPSTFTVYRVDTENMTATVLSGPLRAPSAPAHRLDPSLVGGVPVFTFPAQPGTAAIDLGGRPITLVSPAGVTSALYMEGYTTVYPSSPLMEPPRLRGVPVATSFNSILIAGPPDAPGLWWANVSGSLPLYYATLRPASTTRPAGLVVSQDLVGILSPRGSMLMLEARPQGSPGVLLVASVIDARAEPWRPGIIYVAMASPSRILVQMLYSNGTTGLTLHPVCLSPYNSLNAGRGVRLDGDDALLRVWGAYYSLGTEDDDPEPRQPRITVLEVDRRGLVAVKLENLDPTRSVAVTVTGSWSTTRLYQPGPHGSLTIRIEPGQPIWDPKWSLITIRHGSWGITLARDSVKLVVYTSSWSNLTLKPGPRGLEPSWSLNTIITATLLTTQPITSYSTPTPKPGNTTITNPPAATASCPQWEATLKPLLFSAPGISIAHYKAEAPCRSLTLPLHTINIEAHAALAGWNILVKASDKIREYTTSINPPTLTTSPTWTHPPL